VLWQVIIQECGKECLRGLWPHLGILTTVATAASANETGVSGGFGSLTSPFRAFLRHLNDLYRRTESAEAACAQLMRRCHAASAEVQARCRRSENDFLRVSVNAMEHRRAADAATSELDALRFQVDALTRSLEMANRRAVDASAHWNQQLELERERCLQATIALQDQALLMRDALAAERSERANELQKTRQLVARLDATHDQLFSKGNEIQELERRTAQAQKSAELYQNQMEEAMQRTLALWLKNREEEVSGLKRSLEMAKLGGVGGVSAEEADRSLNLVAALWHAAGCMESQSLSKEASERCADVALNSWRVYFHRPGGVEAPLLKPTSNIILAPLRAATGTRSAEVLVHCTQQPDEPGWIARPPLPSAPWPTPL